MPQCSAGSRPQAAAPAYFWFTWSAFIAWAALRLGRLGTIIWAFFGDSPFDVSVFCATEPVIPSTPTTAQWLGFFTFDFSARVAVEQYLLACFKAYLWPSYCECIPSGTPYVCTTLLNHPYTSALSTGPLPYVGSAIEFVPSANMTVYGGRLSFDAVGTLGVDHGITESGGAMLFYVERIHPTTGDHPYFFATPQNLLAGHTYKYFLEYPNAGYSIPYETVNHTPTTLGGVLYTKSVYANPAHSPWLDNSPECQNTDPLFCPPVDAYYAPLPSDPTPIPDHPEASCSTTADLCSRISAVLAAILQTNRDVNWLQSSEAPTCWVPGTPLVGLAGAGTFAVTDCVGVYVQLTIPGTWGRTSETPARMIPKLGEFHPTVSGVQVQQRELHYAAEQILDFPIATDGISYSLKPGVSATMTPLLRCK